MGQVIIQFEKVIQNIQEWGSDDEHMFSRIFLTIIYPNENSESIEVSIKQMAGGNFEDDPLEVYFPHNKKFSLNYEEFRDAVEKYYRSSFGSQATDFRIEGGSNIKMRNNIVIKLHKIVIESSEESRVGW